MMFFVSLAWLFALRIAEQGRWRDYLWAGVFAGRGDRLQVLGRVHSRRRRRRASGRAAAVRATWMRRPRLARLDRSRAESARRMTRAGVRHHQPDGASLLPQVPPGHRRTDREPADRRRRSRSGLRSSPTSSRSCIGSRPTSGGDSARRWRCGALLGIAWLLWRRDARDDRRRRVSADLLPDRRRHHRADGPLRPAAGAGVRGRGRRLQRVPARSSALANSGHRRDRRGRRRRQRFTRSRT